jgi:hypothetical protein
MHSTYNIAHRNRLSRFIVLIISFAFAVRRASSVQSSERD